MQHFPLARGLTARTAEPLIPPPGFRMELGSKQSYTLCMNLVCKATVINMEPVQIIGVVSYIL
jgi:hypothetical protein